MLASLDEYHQQLHNHDHGSDDLDMEANDEQGFQPVSDAKLQRLGRIVKDLRSRVPISAEAPGEKTMIPDTKDVSHSFISIWEGPWISYVYDLVCRLYGTKHGPCGWIPVHRG